MPIARILASLLIAGFAVAPAAARAQAHPAMPAAESAGARLGCERDDAGDAALARACAERRAADAQDRLSRTYRVVWASTAAAERAEFARRERDWLDGRFEAARRCADAAVAAGGSSGAPAAADDARVQAAALGCLARATEARADALSAFAVRAVAAQAR